MTTFMLNSRNFKVGRFWVQYHRMPKYLGERKTVAPSYIRFFFGSKWLFDIPMFKYGRED